MRNTNLEDIAPGAYDIRAVDPETPGAVICGTCGRAWTEDITPAGRCPWEDEHNVEDDDELGDEAVVRDVITDKHFRLDIRLSNAAMLTGDDIADALRVLAHNHVFDHVEARAIYDGNGEVVGKWEIVEVARG